VIVEHAQLRVTPGREEEFEASIARALPIIESAPGCRGAEVRRQVEDPTTYLLLVRWDSVPVHLEFRTTELFGRWRALTHVFYVEPPTVTHFGEPLPR
jgi:heme-degrading monooxygenase HmoA